MFHYIYIMNNAINTTEVRNITVKVYEANGEKYVTDMMSRREAQAWVAKYQPKTYDAYNHDTDREIKL